MDKTERKLRNLIDAFFARLYSNEFTLSSFIINETRLIKKSVQPWKNDAGVYYFIQNDEVKYVGRATPNVGLGKRLYEQANAFGGKDGWDNVIGDPDVICGLIIFNNKDDWHWLAALEVILIDKLKPLFNKRL